MYTGMEILHRANGKWVEGTFPIEIKIKNQEIGQSIFDSKVVTVNSLLDLLDEKWISKINFNILITIHIIQSLLDQAEINRLGILES